MGVMSPSASEPMPLVAAQVVTVRRVEGAAGEEAILGSGDATSEATGGFEIALDGRALRTPGRRPMRFASEALAWAVAAEWDSQTGSRGIEPSTMPL